ncbi:TonB-dependent receptor family protein [Ferrovibrio sp.]|uniref:TonB-dependent receptor family protein n=1 Tax=Ferrovibrio sp. TaxID=1917215 RepID=UPI0035AF1803
MKPTALNPTCAGLFATATISLISASLISGGALAQSATPGSVIVLDPVTIEGKKEKPDDAARRRLEAIPGGTALVTSDDLEGKANVTIGDALSASPGVVVQNFFGGNDQPRIQIRGSGLQQNPVQRGILALQDGLPINQADGSYIVGLANPRQAEQIEIYRGYTSNRLGATVLGGALNFISPTGSSAPGASALLEGGSFGQIGAAAQAGMQLGEGDAMLQVSRNQRSGFRDYNDSERTGFDANIGARLTDAVSTRFLLGYTDLDFDVSGPLPKSRLKSNPESVYNGPGSGFGPGPNVVRDRPHREATQLRLGNRTTASVGSHVFDTAVGYTRTEDEFRFPVSAGVQATDSNDYTIVARYAYAPDASHPLPLFESNLRYAIGAANREFYVNRSGSKGALFGRNDLDSTTLSVNAGFNIPIFDAYTLSPGITLSHATRDNDDTYGAATRPTYNAANGTSGTVTARDTSYARDYTGISPSMGLSYRPHPDHMVFGAISRSFEPPTHDDLLATTGGTPNSGPTGFTTTNLDAQTATTLEAGWRGKLGIVNLDAVTYYSWVKDEILSLRDSSGTALGAVNADKTRHLGLEFGGSVQMTDDVGLRLAYVLQDFRFQDDPVRGDNYLAGAPRHLINTAIRYDVTQKFWLQAELTWSPTKTPVDNMNTLYADPYATVGLRSVYDLTDAVSIYGEARNIFDKTYASSTLVVDQAQSNQAAFLPADGRALYAGIKAKF